MSRPCGHDRRLDAARDAFTVLAREMIAQDGHANYALYGSACVLGDLLMMQYTEEGKNPLEVIDRLRSDIEGYVKRLGGGSSGRSANRKT